MQVEVKKTECNFNWDIDARLALDMEISLRRQAPLGCLCCPEILASSTLFPSHD